MAGSCNGSEPSRVYLSRTRPSAVSSHNCPPAVSLIRITRPWATTCLFVTTWSGGSSTKKPVPALSPPSVPGTITCTTAGAYLQWQNSKPNTASGMHVNIASFAAPVSVTVSCRLLKRTISLAENLSITLSIRAMSHSLRASGANPHLRQDAVRRRESVPLCRSTRPHESNQHLGLLLPRPDSIRHSELIV